MTTTLIHWKPGFSQPSFRRLLYRSVQLLHTIMKTCYFPLLIILFILMGSCQLEPEQRPPYVYQQPQQLADGLPVQSLKQQRMDTTLFYKFFNQLPPAKKHNLSSMLLLRHDSLVLEQYFGNYNLTRAHDLRSATKSITSLLAGIAIDQGFIRSIDDPIHLYLKEYAAVQTPDKDDITIRNLLTMSSGLDCNDRQPSSPGNEEKMYKKNDWNQFILNLPVVREPGDSSLYCTGGVVVLGQVIQNASGMKLDAFADKYLFQPLGITGYQWQYFNDRKDVDSGGHLYLKPRDMAKIGLLVANKGRWKQQQVVSARWIEQSTAKQTQVDQIDYGFLWWRFPFQVNGKTVEAVTASGNGGQTIFIFPSLSVVAVFTGENYNSSNAKLPFDIVTKVILPSLPKTVD